MKNPIKIEVHDKIAMYKHWRKCPNMRDQGEPSEPTLKNQFIKILRSHEKYNILFRYANNDPRSEAVSDRYIIELRKLLTS